jgi:hypothetical protein
MKRAIQLPMVIGGVVSGALIVFGATWAISGHMNLGFWSLLPAMLGLAIMVICLCVRLRTA